MKLRQVTIHNFRSVLDADIESHDYMLLVGANNAGKSTILNALRAFYDDAKWTAEDFPKAGATDNESWVQLKFHLNDDEWADLADEYKHGIADQSLTVRRYFKSDDPDRVKKDQSNIFGFANGQLSTALFYGAKNVGTAKVGQANEDERSITASQHAQLPAKKGRIQKRCLQGDHHSVRKAES